MLEEIPYKTGVIDGIARKYYENGKIKNEIPYKNGEIHGIVKTYYENGILRQEENILSGKREGITRLFTLGGTVIELLYKEGNIITSHCVGITGKRTLLSETELSRLKNGESIFCE
jgi:antitoxin component YwqK of YwqJK toxin-antitoxin module